MAGTANSPGPELSPAYLAESRVSLVYIFFSLPIFFEVTSTSLRLWVRAAVLRSSLGYEDYLMIGATVRPPSREILLRAMVTGEWAAETVCDLDCLDE